MSEDELKAIEAHGGELTPGRDVMALVAEVRRLRGVVKSLEWGSCDGCGTRRVCTECGGRNDDRDLVTWDVIGGHRESCPAFTPDGAVR